jgi:hypothetical protein
VKPPNMPTTSSVGLYHLRSRVLNPASPADHTRTQRHALRECSYCKRCSFRTGWAVDPSDFVLDRDEPSQTLTNSSYLQRAGSQSLQKYCAVPRIHVSVSCLLTQT